MKAGQRSTVADSLLIGGQAVAWLTFLVATGPWWYPSDSTGVILAVYVGVGLLIVITLASLVAMWASERARAPAAFTCSVVSLALAVATFFVLRSGAMLSMWWGLLRMDW